MTRLKLTVLACISVFVAVSCLDIVAFVRTSLDRIPAAYQFDQGEGLLLGFAAESKAGRSIYPDIKTGPALINNYPPIFLRLMEEGGDEPLDWLRRGRRISMSAALLAALLVGLLAALCCPVGPWPRLLAALFAATSFLALEPVRNWGSLARVDMLGVAAILAGILALRLKGNCGRGLGLICFLIAIFTKQSFFAAPLALIVVIGVRKPKEALGWTTLALVMGGLGLYYLQNASHGQFLFHIVTANQTAFSWGLLNHHLLDFAGIVWPLLPWAAVGYGVASKKEGRRPFLLVWGALSLVALIGMGKTGSSRNYGLEILSSLSIVAGIGFGYTAAWASKSKLSALAFLTVLGGHSILFPPDPMSGHFAAALPLRDRELEAGLQEIQERLRATPGDVLSWDMSLPVLSGKNLKFHPFVIPDLERRGLYDDERLLQGIATGAFVAAVTSFDLANEQLLMEKSRGLAPLYSERMLRAIQERYRLLYRFDLPAHLGGAYLFYIPK